MPDPDTPSQRYTFEDLLGEGGMALVHLAHDGNLDRTVAVKCMRSELADNAQMRERFLDEARIMAELDHPGAIPVYETGQLEKGDLFLAMKRVQGSTLQDLLEARSVEDLRSRHVHVRFISLFERVCETMAAAHDRGIIHRDLKPENIMVDDFGAVYVMDWGLAKKLTDEAEDSSRTHLGQVMGTPQYMSPEQADGAALKADRQTDVFSLGVMLYEILTGTKPFKGKTVQETMKQVLYTDPEHPREVNPRASRALSAVCIKAITKDPSHRYPSAKELMQDIRRHREHLPVSALKPRLIDRLYHWSQRNPRLATTLATLSFVAVVGLAAISIQASLERHVVEEAYDTLDHSLAVYERLDREIAQVFREIENAADPQELRRLEARLQAFQARRDIEELHLLGMTTSIMGFTYFSPEDKARAVLRTLARDTVDLHLAKNEDILAHAELRWILWKFRTQNTANYSEAEIAWFETNLEEVEARLEEQGLLGLALEAEEMVRRQDPLEE